MPTGSIASCRFEIYRRGVASFPLPHAGEGAEQSEAGGGSLRESPCERAPTPALPRMRERERNPTLLRRGVARPSDIAGWLAEALHHHGRQVLGLAGDAGAGAHGVTVLMRQMLRRLALL